MGFIHVLYFCVCTLYQCECICFVLADCCRKTSVISDTFECNSSYVIIVALCTLPWGIDTLATILWCLEVVELCSFQQGDARACNPNPCLHAHCFWNVEKIRTYMYTLYVYTRFAVYHIMVLAPHRGGFLRVQFLLTGYLYHFRRFNFQRMHTLAPIIHCKFILPI